MSVRISRVKPTIPFREECYGTMGACFEVCKRNGRGFKEANCHEHVQILSRPKPEAG